MIKVDMNKIEFKGILPLLETEFASIVRGLFERVYKDMYGEHAEEKIRRDFERGLMSEEEEKKDIMDEAAELMMQVAGEKDIDDGFEENSDEIDEILDKAIDELARVFAKRKKDVPHSES